MSRLVAITGGIGAGKSVVSRCVEAMGFDVYDCDTRAKLLMQCEEMLDAIERDIAPGSVDPATRQLNRKILARVVFNNRGALDRLNRLVHGAVREDITQWQSRLKADMAFVETAILYQSRLDKMVDEVWEITAPVDIRLQRILVRGEGLMAEDARARIATQDSYIPASVHPLVKVIVNDNRRPIIPQILEALGQRL